MGFYDAIRIGASGAADTAYTVDRSLRFDRGGSNSYLNRTHSASNRTTWTWSAWIKRVKSNEEELLFGAFTPSSNGNSNYNVIQFRDDTFRLGVWTANLRVTTQLFRDFSSWYHFVVVFDSTNSTADDRARIYVNGSRITSFSTNTTISQNQEYAINSNMDHRVGGRTTSGGENQNANCYMAEVNFLDGYAYDPSYFGQTDAVTGQWNPKKYTGSYGSNGFYLNFSDNSGTTATTLGKDSSGNGNNFTPNNFSVSAGTGNDSLEDSPTNNFCSLNSVKKDGQTTLSNGNLQASGSQTSTYNINTQGTFAQSSGKWYYEVEFTSGSGSCAVGWARTTLRSSDNPTTGGGIVYRPANGDYVDLAANNPTTPPTTSTGTVIQVAIDFDAGKIWFGSGGTYFNSGDPSAGSNEAMTFTGGSELLAPVVRTMAATFNLNFGQRAFSYTVPTGYDTLCSANLPDPTILLPNKHFDSLLFTANASTQVVTGLNFQPDWVWGKSRSDNYDHELYDAVRGPLKRLKSNATDQELTNSQNLQSFNSNGFTLGSQTNMNYNSGSNIVAWNWNAGDTDGKTYTVTVVSDSGNKYRFDGFGTSAVTLDLAEGGTYIFNYPSGHPFRFSTTADGTHGGGSEYTTGVTHNSSTQVTIVVAASAPTLYYYCGSHSGMGGQVNTNSTLGSSNFDGTGQSTAKVNASAGFSITSYTGNSTGEGVTQTIGHGLGVTPQLIILKSRSWSSGSAHWAVHHHKITDANTDYLKLNNNSATTTGDTAYMNQTLPTSTVFSLGYNYTTNKSSETYIAYCFSEVAGYSKFGSYTGNGNADGTFVFTGFRPAWVMIKNTVSGHNWQIYDSTRSTVNPALVTLYANRELDEEDNTSVTPFDILSNGFKIRSTWNDTNQSGSSIIYLAFAESPFKNARAR